jgi:predicted RNA-binding Zn ribbon-like protein
MTGVRLAVALVNLPEPWDAAVVQRVLEEHWISRVELSDPVCDGLRQLAERLWSVFHAATVEDRCGTINALLAGSASPFLTTHDGLPPHLHFASSEDELVSRVAAFTAGSPAMFIVEASGRRLGSCAREGCRTVFVDTSLNGRRAYCSSRCGNSDAVERHRQRKRALASA